MFQRTRTVVSSLLVATLFHAVVQLPAQAKEVPHWPYSKTANYRSTVSWERYYQYARTCEDKGNKQLAGKYYDAAFAEAEKYFAAHPNDEMDFIVSGDLTLLVSKLQRDSMDSAANPMLKAADLATSTKGVPDADTLSKITELYNTSQTKMSGNSALNKRVYRLYYNAYGANDTHTRGAYQLMTK